MIFLAMWIAVAEPQPKDMPVQDAAQTSAPEMSQADLQASWKQYADEYADAHCIGNTCYDEVVNTSKVEEEVCIDHQCESEQD